MPRHMITLEFSVAPELAKEYERIAARRAPRKANYSAEW